MSTENQHTIKLLERCESGDKQAQFEIYKKYYKAMYNTSYRIVGDTFEAEDIMQEAFLSAFTKLDSFSGKVTFGAWLKKIVVNRSLSSLKKNQRMETVQLETVDYEMESDTPVDYKMLKGTEVLNKINQLKSNYKIAITLNLIEGYDYEEIAHIMEISYENSRTTISRAKQKLRQLLSK